MKLVVDEPETASLRRWLRGRPDAVSSIVAAVELRRAARRSAVASGRQPDELLPLADAVLADVDLIALDAALVRRAVSVDPPALRSLDAIHVASAASVEGLDGLVTYDVRLAEAAAGAGLVVFSPGA